MIHLTDVTWIQMLLIEVGVVLQVVAVFAYFKGTFNYYRRAHHGNEASDERDEVRDFQTGGHSEAARSPVENDGPAHHHEFKGGRLTRTAKVGGFVQSFKFRE